jgi:hypothetical protein
MPFCRSLACLGGLLALSLLTRPILAEEPVKTPTVAHIKLSGSPGEGRPRGPLRSARKTSRPSSTASRRRATTRRCVPLPARRGPQRRLGQGG